MTKATQAAKSRSACMRDAGAQDRSHAVGGAGAGSNGLGGVRVGGPTSRISDWPWSGNERP